jgi:hypothetical protein
MMNGMLTPEQHELLRAAEEFDPKAVRAVLDKGTVDVNATVNGNDETALYLAVHYEVMGTEVQQMLLDAGADPNVANRAGKTPLHLAAQIGRLDKIHPLLRHGGDLNRQDANGDTALHLAASYGREDVALELMQLGADSNIKADNGQTSWEQGTASIKGGLHEALRDNQVPPLLGADRSASRAALKTTVDNGLCPMDAGLTWMRVAEWLPQLEARGDTLEKPLLLSAGKNGMSYLERAVYNGAGQEMLDHMQQQGQSLYAQDLLEEGEPNGLLNALVEKQLVQSLFSYEAWKGRPAQEMRALYKALPEAGQEQVRNMHMLSVQLRDDAARQQPAAVGR